MRENFKPKIFTSEFPSFFVLIIFLVKLIRSPEKQSILAFDEEEEVHPCYASVKL